MASLGVGAAAAAGVFTVPVVGWAVGLAAAYIDATIIYPALAGSHDEPRLPQLASLPVSEHGPGAARLFAIGARMRVPAHCMYQSSKAREGSSGGGKGGTSVSLKRVFVNALIHLNDRESSRMLQLIGNGQLILYTERNLIGITSERLSAAVSGSNVVVSLVDRYDPDFRDTFKVGDVLIAYDFIYVAGPTTWNGTYYEVNAIAAATATTGSTVTVQPIDGQSVTSLAYTGGTPFSPARVMRVDDAIAGTAVTLLARAFSSQFLYHIKNPGRIDPGSVFNVNDRVRIRNGNMVSVGAANNNPLTGDVRRILDAGATLEVAVDAPLPLPSGIAVNVPAVSGKEIIVDFDETSNFASGIFPEGFDSEANYLSGETTQGQPSVLLTDYGSGNTSNYRGMATQGLVECYVSAFGDQLPTNLEAIIEVDDDQTWPQALEVVMQRSNLLNTQIDVSQVPQRPFRGAYVRGVNPVARQLQPMLVAGQIVPQDQNGVVRLFSVDNADSVQLENGAVFTDLGARIGGQSANYDKTQMEDKPQADMPTSVGVRFQDPDNAFTIGFEHFGLRNPGGVDHVNEQQMDLSSLVLSRREARNLATTLMRRAWVNRRTYRFTLPSAYLHLLENDIVTWTDDEGIVITARIVQRDIGANYLVNVTALSEMTDLAVAGSPVQTSSQVVPQQTGATALVLTVAIDAPGIANAEVVTPAIRLAVADMTGTLQAATVWESQDGNSYLPVGTIGGTSAVGALITNLSAQTASEVHGTTTVTLRSQSVNMLWLNEGTATIEACTQAQAEAGKNWCAIMDSVTGKVEIAAFTTVADNGDGTFALGAWLRGLRGTDSGAQIAANQYYIVMLNQSVDGLFWREFVGPLPSTVSYKIVPAGGDLATATVTTITPKFANALPLPVRKVYKVTGSSPYNVRFVLSDSTATPPANRISTHWTRYVLPLGEQPPHSLLPEPFEAYRFDIYDPTGATLLRSHTVRAQGSGTFALRDPWFDYSAANQTTDGYTPAASETFWVDVVQIGQFGESPSIKEEI